MKISSETAVMCHSTEQSNIILTSLIDIDHFVTLFPTPLSDTLGLLWHGVYRPLPI